MNLDQTQALVERDDDEGDERNKKRRKTTTTRDVPVAVLRILGHDCFSETEFPLFAGETVVGRDPGCGVCVPVASLSRRHAAFEASPPPDDGGGDDDDSDESPAAFVRDLGSLNGTRRGRLTLRPHARYEIRDGDVVSFGEVRAIFRTSRTVAASVSNKEPVGEAAAAAAHDDDTAAVAAADDGDDDAHPAAAGEDETDSDLDIFPDESDRTNGRGESIGEAEREGREKESWNSERETQERGKIPEGRATESKNSKIPQPSTAELWAELRIESDVGKGEDSGKDSSSAGVGNSYTGNSDTGNSDTGNVSAGIPKEGRGRGLVIEESWLEEEEEEGGHRRQLPLEETQDYVGAVGGAVLLLGETPVAPPPLGRSGGGDGGPRVIATGSTGSPSCLDQRRRRRRGAGRTIADEHLSPSDTVVPDSEEERNDSGPLIPAPRKCLRLDFSSTESETDSAQDQTASQPIPLRRPQANLARRSDQDLDVTPGHRHHQQQQQQQQQELQSSGSETDIEDLEVEQGVGGGGGGSCKADEGASVKLTAKLPQQAPEFHMDSDTDIEEDDGDGGDGGGGGGDGGVAQAIAGAAGAASPEDTDQDDDSEDDVHLLGGWIRQPGARVEAGLEAELGAVLHQESSPQSLSDMPTQHFPCIDEVETQAYVYPKQSHWTSLFPNSSNSSMQPCGAGSPSHPPPSSASPPSTSSALPMAPETSPSSSSSSLDETQPMEQYVGNKRQETAAVSPATGACHFDDCEPTQPVERLFGVGNDREISPGTSGGWEVGSASACRASRGRLSKSRRSTAKVSVEVSPSGARGGRGVGGGAGKDGAQKEVGGEAAVEAADETLGPQGELPRASKEAGDVGTPSTEEAEGGESLGGDSGGPARDGGDGGDGVAAALVEKRDRGEEETGADGGLMNAEGGNSASTTGNPEGVQTASSDDDETIDLDAEFPAESREGEPTGGDEPLRSDTGGQSTDPPEESSEGGGEAEAGGGVSGETTAKTLSLTTERPAEDPKVDGDGEKTATESEDSLPSTAAGCPSTGGEDRGREGASTQTDAASLGPRSASTETGDAGEKSTERQGASPPPPQTAVPPTPAGNGEEVPPAAENNTAGSLPPGIPSSSKRGGRLGGKSSGKKGVPGERETAGGSATSGAREAAAAAVVEGETRRPTEVEPPGTSKKPGRKSARKRNDLQTAAASGEAKGNSDVPSTAVGAETRHPGARRPEAPRKLGRPSAKAQGDLFGSETWVAPVEGEGRDELTAGVEEAAPAAELDRPETLKKVGKASPGERESPGEARHGGDPPSEDGEETRARRTECPESSKKLGKKRSAEDGDCAPPGECGRSGDGEEARLGGGDGDGGGSSAEPSTPAGRNAPRRSVRTPSAGRGGRKPATAKRGGTAAPPPEPGTQPEPPRSRRQRSLTVVVKRLAKVTGAELPEGLTKSRDHGEEEEGAHVKAAGTVEPLAETSNQRDVNSGHPSPSTRRIGQRRTAAGRSKVASSEDDATEQVGRVVEDVPISSSMDRKTRAKQKAATATSAAVAVKPSGGAGSDVATAPHDDKTGSDVARTPRDDRTGSDVARAKRDDKTGSDVTRTTHDRTGSDVTITSRNDRTGSDVAKARGNVRRGRNPRSSAAATGGGDAGSDAGSDAVDAGSSGVDTGSSGVDAGTNVARTGRGAPSKAGDGRAEGAVVAAGSDVTAAGSGVGDAVRTESVAPGTGSDGAAATPRTGKVAQGRAPGRAKGAATPQRRRRRAGGGDDDGGDGGDDETNGALARGGEVHLVIWPDDPREAESGGGGGTAPQEETRRRRRGRPQQQQVAPQEVPPPLAASHNAAGQEEGSSDAAAAATAASDDGDGGNGAGGATIPPLTLSTRKRRGATEQPTAPQKSRRNSRKPGTSATSGTSQAADAPGTPQGSGGPPGNSGTPEGTPQGRGAASGNSGTPEIPQRPGTPQGRGAASRNSGTPEIPQRTGTPQGSRGASGNSGTPTTPGISGGRGTPRSARNPRGDVPKVAFTGVAELEALEQRVRALGWAVSASARHCSHLVTDRVCRTVKMLCAVARGVPVVTPAWIQQCEQSGRVVDTDAFIVSDEEQEAKFHFRLRESLLAARERPLFHGCRVHVTAGVKPEPVHMRDIVECGGATWLPKVPRTAQAGVLVVSCPEDSVRLRDCRGVDVVSAELILTGVLRQRLDVDAHRLSTSRGDEADSSDIDGGGDVEQRGRKRASVPAARGAQVSSKRRR
ncbi:unnamed protein product [Lampetra fluviatilis]